jgi:L-lactate dehydrogenase
LVTATLLKWILRGERRVVTLSTVLDPIFGFGEVALSLPVLISDNGIERVVKLRGTPDEEMDLIKSAEIISNAIESAKS